MTDDLGERWDEDPGWPFGWRSLVFMIPYVHIIYMRQTRGDPLVNLRNLYVSFLGSLVAYGLVVPFVVPFRGDQATFPWVIALVVCAIVTFGFPRVVERPMPCDALAGYFRTRFFLRIAFANTTALFGFVFAFTAESNWLYYFGVLLSIPGLVRGAPTKGALIREQDDLTARGCNQSLVAALRTTPPRPK